MVLITTSNTIEDSQGTQLRISKKLTTVCSGKRSRFSKPRPNLSISKRGESNVPAIPCKARETSDKDVNTSSNTNINTKIQEETVQIISLEDANKKVEDIKIISCEDANKKIVEDDIEIIPPEKTIKPLFKKGPHVVSSLNSENPISQKDVQVIPSTNAELFDSVGDIQVFSDSSVKKLSPDEDIQVISNTDTEKPLSPLSKEDSPIISSTNAKKNSKENDLRTRPVKNSGSPLKVCDSERRNTSNTATSVIDKSKYPHLTSILTKKRTEPRKEVQQKRRKKFKKGDAPPERSKMTMADLIYWNPTKTDDSQKNVVTVNEAPKDNVSVVEEESIDDVGESENNIPDSVPKLVISEDGQINIDQSSLFVSRNVPQLISTEIVRKDDTTYSSFRKRPLTKHWTAKDTANFYRALSLVGADFSLMEQIFPNRTRRELKQKFKREEKFNIDIINKVLYESQTFDELTLNDFMDQNSVTDDPILINENDDGQIAVKEKSRKQRTYKKAKSIENEACDSSVDHLEEETEYEKPEKNKGRKKKTKKLSEDEDVEILISGYLNYNNDTGELKGSKRKRNAKKLPDGFVSIDSIEDLEVLSDDEANNEDPFEKVKFVKTQDSSYDAEVENDVEEIPSESACVILDKIINGSENVTIEQNLKEEISNDIVPSPLLTNASKEYSSDKYIKDDDVDTDFTMLDDVMAYEVVNTQTPVPKKKRKINSILPAKTRNLFLATHISPTNYSTFTPI